MERVDALASELVAVSEFCRERNDFSPELFIGPQKSRMKLQGQLVEGSIHRMSTRKPKSYRRKNKDYKPKSFEEMSDRQLMAMLARHRPEWKAAIAETLPEMRETKRPRRTPKI